MDSITHKTAQIIGNLGFPDKEQHRLLCEVIMPRFKRVQSYKIVRGVACVAIVIIAILLIFCFKDKAADNRAKTLVAVTGAILAILSIFSPKFNITQQDVVKILGKPIVNTDIDAINELLTKDSQAYNRIIQLVLVLGGAAIMYIGFIT